MSVVIPDTRPELLKGLEADFGTTIASQIWKKIAETIAYSHVNCPLGAIRLFYSAQQKTDLSYVEPPNPNIWILTDGRIINDSESILNGLNTPNLSGRFIKHTLQGMLGGQTTVDLRHNHGGGTTYARSYGFYCADPGGGAEQGSWHNHSIGYDLSTPENFIPPHVKLQAYMRYK